MRDYLYSHSISGMHASCIHISWCQNTNFLQACLSLDRFQDGNQDTKESTKGAHLSIDGVLHGEYIRRL
jgi:hypothetical protein